MIVTKDFVFINFPKTGSTFVRNVLKKVHYQQGGKKEMIKQFLGLRSKSVLQKEFQTLLLPELRDYNLSERYLQPREHGLRFQIPKEYKHLPIYSIKRSPLEVFVSLYEYRDWIKTLPLPENEVKLRFPTFPDLSFKEFLDFSFHFSYYDNHPKVKKSTSLNSFLSNYVLFFSSTNPFDLINNWDDNSIEVFKRDMADVHFLENNNLNQELYQLLASYNYPSKEIDFILNASKQNVSKPKAKGYQDYYSKELLDMVLNKTGLIFELFPEYLNTIKSFA